ncbi:MAG: DNA polymerase III subunit delta', partial [Pseudomonadota bacterium]
IGLAALARHAGAPQRWVPPGSVPAAASLPALQRWLDELIRIARHAEHPWHEGLMGDALAARARAAFSGRAA